MSAELGRESVSGCVVRQFSATRLSEARRFLRGGGHVVLFGRPKNRPNYEVSPKSARFTVKVYRTGDEELVETLMEEQPYRHYVGFFTSEILLDDLKEEVESLIWSRYKVAL